VFVERGIDSYQGRLVLRTGSLRENEEAGKHRKVIAGDGLLEEPFH